MIFKVYFDQANAVRHGVNRCGNLDLDIDPARLSQEERDLVAAEYNECNRPHVKTIDAAGFVLSLREKVAAREREAAEQAAKRAEKIAFALTAPVEELVSKTTVRSTGVQTWKLREVSSEYWATLPNDPRVIERIERELAPAVAAHNAEAEKAIKEYELAQKLERLEQHSKDRRTLADFLAAIPADALRGTLKRLAASDEAIEALRKKVQDASPVVIFEDDEESDDEE